MTTNGPLAHHLEQRGLRLRRAAVDLVGQHHVGEHAAGVELEALHVLVVDLHAGDVTGQQVRGELDAAPRSADAAGQAPGERGLAEPGHVFHEHVPLGEQRGHGQSHDLRLATHHGLHVVRDPFVDLVRGRLAHAYSQRIFGDVATSAPDESVAVTQT
jgi:hypothetical protein